MADSCRCRVTDSHTAGAHSFWNSLHRAWNSPANKHIMKRCMPSTVHVHKHAYNVHVCDRVWHSLEHGKNTGDMHKVRCKYRKMGWSIWHSFCTQLWQCGWWFCSPRRSCLKAQDQFDLPRPCHNYVKHTYICTKRVCGTEWKHLLPKKPG